MTVHVGELTSQVEVTGVGGGQQGEDRAAGKPPSWAERQRFADLAEECEQARARTAGGGFDG
jgi:hypothetical protein